MALSSQFVLNQVVVEIQYARGARYFDKCGSLQLALEDALGKPFVATMHPSMSHAELQSAAERVTVQFGPATFTATQTWMQTPVRLEQVLPTAWELVATSLDVGEAVTRCGVRIQLLWKVDSFEEGRKRLVGSPLLRIDEAWRTIVGDAVPRSTVLITEDRRGRLRAALDVVEMKLEGGTLPDELATMVPRYSVVLDLDHVHPGESRYGLTKAALKDYFRASWQRTKDAATTVRGMLGDQ